jgi:hypothetical protein
MYHVFIFVVWNRKIFFEKNKWVDLKWDRTAEQFSVLLLKIGDRKYPASEEKITLSTRLGVYCCNNLQKKYILLSKILKKYQ